MNEIGRKVAEAKRLINADKPLAGDILEFALGLMPDLPPTHNPSDGDQVWLSIERKLRGGEKLGDYEYHLLVEVVFLHVRLQAEAMEHEAPKTYVVHRDVVAEIEAELKAANVEVGD